MSGIQDSEDPLAGALASPHKKGKPSCRLHGRAQGTRPGQAVSPSVLRNRGLLMVAELGEPKHPPLGQQFVHFFHEASAAAPTARPVGVGLGGSAGTGASRSILRLRGKDQRFSLPGWVHLRG